MTGIVLLANMSMTLRDELPCLVLDQPDCIRI
jgi:hypothetical protein